MRVFVASVLLVLAACGVAPDHINLDERWRPLLRVERASWVPSGAAQTASPVVYVGDLEAFVRQSIAQQNALLAHERVHAISQEAIGLARYQRDYANVAQFRRDEERAGWREQIRWLVRAGEIPNPYTIADFMATRYQGAFQYDSSLAWVSSEISAARAGK